jgi:rhodanese-related sulfurtransferase
MAPYFSFLMEHWILSSAFVVLLILILLNEWRYRSSGLTGIGPQQLVDFLNHSGGVVLDIRSSEQYEQGHILGAMNIAPADFEKRLNALNKYKTKPVIAVCAKGLDSPKVSRLLVENGFTKLYYLTGGVDGWKSSGLPLVKK